MSLQEFLHRLRSALLLEVWCYSNPSWPVAYLYTKNNVYLTPNSETPNFILMCLYPTELSSSWQWPSVSSILFPLFSIVLLNLRWHLLWYFALWTTMTSSNRRLYPVYSFLMNVKVHPILNFIRFSATEVYPLWRHFFSNVMVVISVLSCPLARWHRFKLISVWHTDLSSLDALDF